MDVLPNKLKIFNDPVYGFININYPSVFDVLENPYFQRLRRIKQLGLSHLVYPGALHTRFQHAMGAMYLMGQAIETLRNKGHIVLEHEAEAAILAILMHDIGHGPFSHTLEHTIIKDIGHEKLSLLFMHKIKEQLPQKDLLQTAIDIFSGTYPKQYLHQLVSGQLDMDRLDYLNRDSFFTGVSEGVVSYDRIIKTLNISGDNLVTDEKGIYSLEKFVIARRLMYWQVYLHKTVISAEKLLVSILRRAAFLAMDGQDVFCTPALKSFLYGNINPDNFYQNPHLLDSFALLDDYDIFAGVKVWQSHPDKTLALLCRNLVNRNLFRIELSREPIADDYVQKLRELTRKKLGIAPHESKYFVVSGQTENNAYDPGVGNILILQKNGKVQDMAEISDQLNIRVLSNPVTKYFICYPKEIGEML